MKPKHSTQVIFKFIYFILHFSSTYIYDIKNTVKTNKTHKSSM